MLNGDRDRVVSLEGKPARQHLIKHNASGVDIGTGIDMAAPGLLWGDIMHGANGLLGHGNLGSGGTGDAEVRHLNAAVPEHHDVLGLDVPVDDAPAMGVLQALEDLHDKV